MVLAEFILEISWRFLTIILSLCDVVTVITCCHHDVPNVGDCEVTSVSSVDDAVYDAN